MASHSPTVNRGQPVPRLQTVAEPEAEARGKAESLVNGCLQDATKPTLSSDVDKAAQIRAACSQQDLESLRSLAATPGGLLADDLRRRAWPLLLSVDLQATHHPQADWESLPAHKDEGQVKLDVDRAFVYYPSEPDAQLSRRKASLQILINAVLRRHPCLCYFQGYHDIVQVFLLVFGSLPSNRPSEQSSQPQELATCMACVERLSLLRIRDFMLPTLGGLNAHMALLPSILEAADRELYVHVRQAHKSYSLSGMLTLYAHEIQEYGVIARLLDFLLATDAVMSVYLFGAIILSRRETLFDIESTDTDILLYTLSKLPQPFDVEALITNSLHLYSQYPPRLLPNKAWSQISSNSVLKTCICETDRSREFGDTISFLGAGRRASRTKNFRPFIPFEKQSLSDGEVYFHAQAAELKRAEELENLRKGALKLWIRYRKPVRNTALFLTAAVLAYWFRPGTSMNANIIYILKSIRETWLSR